MANTYTTLNDLFTGIADAIRTKKNSTDVIVADNFPAEIENLKTGFDYSNQNVTAIPDYAFYGCEDLKSVDCVNLTSVGENAFENCTNLESVILYEGVTSVGEDAFKGCGNAVIYCEAESIPETWHENFNPDNCEVVLDSFLVEAWDVSKTTNDNVTAKLYRDPSVANKYSLVIRGVGNMKDYKIADDPAYSYPISPYSKCIKYVNQCTIGDGVTSISFQAFCRSRLTTVLFPDGFMYIGAQAFQGCGLLSSVVIPVSVTKIDTNAFHDCRALTTITYTGTIAQWNNIIFGGWWNYGTPDYTIHCTDGDIAKDGTITYHTTT